MFGIILLAVTAIVAACPPPFNSFNSQSNQTHTNAKRWTEVVSQSYPARMVWPDGLIRYCFNDKFARDNYEQDIKAAWDMWSHKIGPAGPEAGHTLKFREYDFPDTKYPYCYLENTYTWNPFIAGDTLSIGNEVEHDVQASAIAGYVPKDFNDNTGRHQLRLNNNYKQRYPYQYWVTTVAHELGHIFGFWHEHQREDRESYVHFDCTKLQGYDEAKVRVEADGSFNMHQVCNDHHLANRYDFTAINDFDTMDHSVDGKDGTSHSLFINTSFDFDDESIMLYSSSEWMNKNSDSHNVNEVPLAFWKDRGMGVKHPNSPQDGELELIEPNWEVSSGDCEGIRALYPWKG